MKKLGSCARSVALAGVVLGASASGAFAQTTPSGVTAVDTVFTSADLEGTSNELITKAGGPAVILMAAIAAFGAAWGLAGKARRIGR